MCKTLFLFLFFAISAVSSLPPDTKTRVVNIGEAKLFCRTMGQGKPLIVLHGGPGLSQEYLLPYLSRLADNHFVIFYDQRGSGRSEGGEEKISVPVFVDDLEEIRKQFGLEKMDVLGHSWGGFLAMQYAISHPEAVDKLALLNTLPASSREIELFIQEYLRRMAPFMKEVDAVQNSPKFVAGDPETFAEYLRIIFRTYCATPEKADELSLFSSTEANLRFIQTTGVFDQTLFANSFDLSDDLRKLSCETLIIHGDQDPIPLPTVQTIHKNIKNSKFVVIEDCGHFPYIEKPTQLFDALDAFL